MITGTKAFKVVALALFASLALNVYLGALELGCWWRDGGKQTGISEQWKKREELLREKLSPEDFAVVQSQRKESKARFKESRKALDQARDNVGKAMQAEPFDPAVLEAALEAEKTIKLEMLARMQERRRALADQLSPEGSEAFKSIMRDKDLYRKMQEQHEGGSRRPAP